MKNWILATRPKTLFASLAPVLLGLSVAKAETGKLNLTIALLTVACAMLLQIASNLANDYLDALKGVDDHNRLGPTRVTSSGLISHSKMRMALIISLSFAFLLGIYLMIVGGPVIMIIGILSIYFAYGYTGGPFPLSYNGLGEIAAFVFFGLLAVIGTSFLQTNEITPLALWAGVGPGFISACILAVNNLRDIKSDTLTSKGTLAVRFGEKFQRRLCIAMIIASMLTLIAIALIFDIKEIYPLLIIPIFFHKTWLQLLYGPIDEKLNLALQRTAQYNLVYCLTLSAVIIRGLTP